MSGRSEWRASSSRDVTFAIDQPHIHSLVKVSLLKVQELNHSGRQLLRLSTLAPEMDNSVFASLSAEVKINDEDGGLQLFHGTILAGSRPQPRMCPDCHTFPALYGIVTRKPSVASAEQLETYPEE